MKKAKQGAVPVPKKNLWKQIAKHWEFYVLLLPGIILTIIFKYVPMYGVQIAFRDYNPVGGFFGSPWVGLKWFERFFNNYNSIRMIKNTVLLSLYSILWTFPIPIILALLINQVKWKKFQRVSQTILYAPHFISTMILCGMLRIFLSPYGGLISTIIQAFGGKATNLIDSATAFRTIYISSSVWQDAGWGTIIYIATLSSVDASLHEAARVDGSGELRIMWNIVIPTMKASISSLGILLFINSWNDYMWPMLLSKRLEDAPLQIGLKMFVSSDVNLWGSLMAATTVSCIPILVFYLVMQKNIVNSFMKWGLK